MFAIPIQSAQKLVLAGMNADLSQFDAEKSAAEFGGFDEPQDGFKAKVVGATGGAGIRCRLWRTVVMIGCLHSRLELSGAASSSVMSWRSAACIKVL